MSNIVAPSGPPGRLPIDLGALADNWRKLAGPGGPLGDVAAVVKADAYGIGLAEAAPALWEGGARVFFVAHLGEGVAARRLLVGVLKSTCSTASKRAGRPGGLCASSPGKVVGAEDDLERWTAFAARERRPARARSISTPA